MTTALRVDGVDISHHQSRTLDLRAAQRAGVKFLWHKATEGTSFTDDRYTARRKEARAAGLPFGAYHFAHPEHGDAVQEADYFLEHADPEPGDLVPALDLEVNSLRMSEAELTTWVAKWVRRVRRITGVHPVIYTPFDLNDPAARFKLGADFGCLLWQPRYNDDNRPPVTAEPWNKVDIWQFSNGVLGVPDQVAGFGHVDLNHMRDGLRVSDFTIPADDPEPPKPGRTPRMRFVTQNVRALPLMPQADVTEDVELAASQAGVIGWQEIGPARYKDAVQALDPEEWTTWWGGHRDDRQFDCPISYRHGNYRRAGGGSWLLHDGHEAGNVERWYAWLLLEERGTGAPFLTVNRHYVARAWNAKPDPHKAERVRLWRQDRDREVLFLEGKLAELGGPALVMLGDSNGAIADGGAQDDEYPRRIAGRRIHFLTGPKSIDTVALVDGLRWEWEIDDADGELLPGRNSDHQGRRGVGRLVKAPR